MRMDFPKIRAQPVNRGTFAYPLMFNRRDCPWMNGSIVREMVAGDLGVSSVRIVDKLNPAVFSVDESVVFDYTKD
jgi:hypothetical protein